MTKKKLLTCALALLSVAAIASCGESGDGGKEGGNSGESTAEFDEKVAALGDLKSLNCDITFWHTMGKTNQQTFEKMITAFNAIYPGIKITHSQQGGYDDVKKNVSDAIPAGTTPTMTYCYPDHVADYLPSDSVVKLDNYMNSSLIGLGVDNGLGDGAASDYIPAYLDEGNHYTVNGAAVKGYYSMPFSKSTEVLFYNKDAFETNGWEVPKTWDQMWTLCEKIKTAYPDSIPLGYDSDANFFITYCAQANIPYTTGEGSEHFLFNNQQAKDFINKIKGYSSVTKEDGSYVIDGAKGYWTSQTQLGSGTYTSTKFTNQELYMSIGSTGGTTYNVSADFETGVAALPQYDLSNGKVIMQGPSICFLSDSSFAQRVGAWLFYKYITNAHNSAVWSSETGYNPVRTSSYSDSAYKTSSKSLVNTVLEFAATGSDYTRWYYTSPSFKGSTAARAQVENMMSGVLNGTKTVDKAFEDAYAECLFAA